MTSPQTESGRAPRLFHFFHFFILFLYRLHATLCGFHRLNGSVRIEEHAVDTGLAMNTWAFFPLNIILVDAMIDDVPFVASQYLKYTIVGRAIDFVGRVLNEHDRLLSHLNGAQRLVTRSVGHMIVG